MSDSSLKKGRFTKFSNRIGLYSNQTGNYIANTPEVVLNFPFKDTVLEGGMTKEDSGRDERFLHLEIDKRDIDTLEDPKVLTNFKYIDRNGETKLNSNSDIEFFDEDGNLKQNLLIKGNNLLALYSLREKLTGKIKLIYIDPPFNTGSDSFRYNDSFNQSAWLTFMKNRLEVAIDLLSADGIIFVHCDYNEDAYLRVLMDEIFGGRLLGQITVRSNSISGMKTQHKDKTILKNKDTILVYTKADEITITPQYTAKTDWDTHYNSVLIDDGAGKFRIEKLKDVLVDKGLIGKDESITPSLTMNRKVNDYIFEIRDSVFRKVNSIPDNLKKLSLKTPDEVVSLPDSNGKTLYAHGGKRLSMLSSILLVIDGEPEMAHVLGDLWTDIDFEDTQNEGGVELTNGKKPEALIRRIIEMSTKEGDIALDFFAGSGTTLAVAMKTGRRWIGIEQMDYIETKTKKRLENVISGEQNGISKHIGWQGGGSFVYMELKKYNQDFLDRLMEVTSISDVEAVYADMQKNAFLKFFFDKKEFEKDENFRSKSWEERRDMLVEILDENQLYLNLQDMRDSKHKVSNDEMVLTDRFYGVNEDAES